MFSGTALVAPKQVSGFISALSRSAWADLFCIVSLCLLSLLFWLPKASGPIDIRWDGGTYYILGTSLAEGNGYRLLNEPGDMLADQYPPLLPAIVALHQKAAGSHDVAVVGVWLRRTWMAISLLYVLSAFLLGRLFLARVYAFWMAVVCLMSYDMYYLSTLLFAELPFALATTLFAYFYLRRGGASWTRHLSPVMAIAAYLLRSLGIALVAAWVADALFRRQFRQATLRTAVALVPVLAWQGYVHSVESSAEYRRPAYAYQRSPALFYNVSYAKNMQLKDPFHPDEGHCSLGDYAYRFFGNVLRMPSTLGQSVTAREGFYEGNVRSLNRTLGRNVIPNWPYELLLNLLGVVVLLGVLRLMRANQWLLAMTIILTLLAVCTTPWPGQFARYIAPILPLLLLSLMAMLRGVFQVRTHFTAPVVGLWLQRLRVVVAVMVLMECSLALQSGFRNYLDKAWYTDGKGVTKPYRLMHYTAAYPEAEKALGWLKTRANRDAVIGVSMPQWVYLQSGFKSVMPPLTGNPQSAMAMADTVPISFYLSEDLLMDDNFLVSFPAMVARSPRDWKLVYGAPHDRVRLYARTGVARLNGAVVSR